MKIRPSSTHRWQRLILGDEAVAGVNGIGAGPFGGGNQSVMDQVTLVGLSRPMQIASSPSGHGKRSGLLGIDSNGADTEIPACPDESVGYLSRLAMSTLRIV